MEFRRGAEAPAARKLMLVRRTVAFALAAALFGAAASGAAELPSQRGQTHKPKQAEPARTCNIAGAPGVLAANGVCVRLSGYISSQFSAGQLR
jgi:hypothetical protein